MRISPLQPYHRCRRASCGSIANSARRCLNTVTGSPPRLIMPRFHCQPHHQNVASHCHPRSNSYRLWRQSCHQGGDLGDKVLHSQSPKPSGLVWLLSMMSLQVDLLTRLDSKCHEMRRKLCSMLSPNGKRRMINSPPHPSSEVHFCWNHPTHTHQTRKTRTR